MSDLIERLRKYVVEFGKMRGQDDVIHSLHRGSERECWIEIGDVSTMLAKLEAQQAEIVWLRSLVEEFCSAAEHVASCTEDGPPDEADSEIMSSMGSVMTVAYRKGLQAMESKSHD